MCLSIYINKTSFIILETSINVRILWNNIILKYMFFQSNSLIFCTMYDFNRKLIWLEMIDIPIISIKILINKRHSYTRVKHATMFVIWSDVSMCLRCSDNAYMRLIRFWRKCAMLDNWHQTNYKLLIDRISY